MNTVPTRRGDRGFSMIEFLVAAFIIAIGLLGLITLQVGSVTQAAAGRGRTTAAYVANLVLQRAQMEGQHYYLAKANTFTPTLPALFTATPGTALANAAFGGFNIDGVQITDAAGTNLTGLATLVPDPNKRGVVYQASWARRAYATNGPASTAQTQEFVVNVTWTESGQTKYLSMSRNIRY
jgi:prepilin-type N-terminal cleavage/methylation domain-containing protein